MVSLKEYYDKYIYILYERTRQDKTITVSFKDKYLNKKMTVPKCVFNLLFFNNDNETLYYNTFIRHYGSKFRNRKIHIILFIGDEFRYMNDNNVNIIYDITLDNYNKYDLELKLNNDKSKKLEQILPYIKNNILEENDNNIEIKENNYKIIIDNTNFLQRMYNYCLKYKPKNLNFTKIVKTKNKNVYELFISVDSSDFEIKGFVIEVAYISKLTEEGENIILSKENFMVDVNRYFNNKEIINVLTHFISLLDKIIDNFD